MKLNYLKSTLKILVMLFIASSLFVSCNKDEDEDDDPVIVLDGIYLKMDAATDEDLTSDVRFKVTRNEVNQEERSSLYELYMAMPANSKFNLVQVAGADKITHGPASDFAIVPEAELDVEEPKEGLWRGSFEETNNQFSVPEEGLYHIMIDTEIGVVAMAKVVWGVIGGATPGGWSESTPMTVTFDENMMEFSVEELTLLENEYKFRYSDGWKVFLDPDIDLGGGVTGVKVNTNYGGSLTDLIPGGDNIANEEYAVYTLTMTWEKGEGHSASIEKTGEAEPLPEYPEELYMIGGALNLEDSDGNDTPDGWQWELTNVPMVPVHSHPNAFWRIVWLEASEGIKFAPGREWVGDFGAADDTQPIPGDHLIGGSNVPAPAEAGYYMVWIDLERDSISITTPEVYLIGDAVGSWDAAVAENMFTVDNPNEVLTITKDLAAADLRMHAWHKWHYDWWQHEFNIFEGVIEYRGTGGDQAAVPVTGGSTTIELDFKEGTGSIQ